MTTSKTHQWETRKCTGEVNDHFSNIIITGGRTGARKREIDVSSTKSKTCNIRFSIVMWQMVVKKLPDNTNSFQAGAV